MKQLILFIIVIFTVACSSNQNEDQVNDQKAPEQKVIPEKESLELDESVTNLSGEELVFKIDSENISLQIDQLPLLKSYLELVEEPKNEIDQMRFSRITTLPDQQLFLLGYSCDVNMCSYLLIDKQGDKLRSFLVSDLSLFREATLSPDYSKIMLTFQRNVSLTVVRNDLVIIDLKKWAFIPLHDKATAFKVLNFQYPIINSSWITNKTIEINIPNVTENTVEAIETWREESKELRTIRLTFKGDEPL